MKSYSPGIFNLRPTSEFCAAFEHFCEISGSHGGEYDGSSKHLWNVGKFIPDYTT
jgi:hypothetical protein